MKQTRRGRRTVEEIERAQTLVNLEKIAFKYAEAAMETIGQAAGGKPVGREVLGAAQYVINQVLGRPAEKDQPDSQTAAIKDLLDDIAEVRKLDISDAHTIAQRVQPLVAEAEDTIPANG